MQAAAVKMTSVEEFNAVSAESCNTPMMKPMATTCMATSLEMLKSEQANGISSKEPPGTPEAPQAHTDASTHNKMAVGMSTAMPKVCAAAKLSTLMVIAAPAMLIVAPSGMATL